MGVRNDHAPVADDVVKVLTPKGVIGWETTGIAFVNPGGTTLLLLLRP